MELKGLHFLLTYQCTFECDHCFVWGSPQQSGVMSLKQVEMILNQAKDLGSLDEIYFEGGEPFMYYPVLVRAVRLAHEMGFTVGIVSNAYWATNPADAREWLRPFTGQIQDLTLSSDLYHYHEMTSCQVLNATQAARELDIPTGLIQVALPEGAEAAPSVGQIAAGVPAAIMYRGRAAVNLAGRAKPQPWESLDRCPYEDLSDSGRLHVDPFGYLHLCQGITLGNLYQTHLRQVLAEYEPSTHPIAEPLLRGGPAELARRYNVPHSAEFADACHFCYSTRLALRARFPEILAPAQMYGVN